MSVVIENLTKPVNGASENGTQPHISISSKTVGIASCTPEREFYWNRENAKGKQVRSSCGELADYLDAIVEAYPGIGYVRWSGISNHLTREDPLPDANTIFTEVKLHWHDCNPVVRIHAATEVAPGEVRTEFVWGIVFEKRGKVSDWSAANLAAAEITGWLNPTDRDPR